MDWLEALSLGAVGGALVQVVSLYGDINAWRAACQEALRRGKRRPPKFSRHIHVPAELAAAITRIVLGAATGFAFHTQVSGVAAAISVGAAAPALLRQLGTTGGAVVQDDENFGRVRPRGSEPAEPPTDQTAAS